MIFSKTHWTQEKLYPDHINSAGFRLIKLPPQKFSVADAQRKRDNFKAMEARLAGIKGIT